MLKIIVITYHPWRDDISVGNTLSNIFRGMEDKIIFANLYIRDDKPCNKIVKRYFHISEKAMLRNIIHFIHPEIGEEVSSVNEDGEKEPFSKGYNAARRLRWDIFLYAQDLIGVFGQWKSKSLDDFIMDFKPDIIFGPLGRIPITNRIMYSLNRKYGIPMVAYAWDDHYSLKKFSFSPFFWARLFLERKYIRLCAKQSKFLYTITPLMQKEYSKLFNKKCKLLYKGYNFDFRPMYRPPVKPFRIIYMGNIGAGRYKTLAKMVSIINRTNGKELKFKLDIYTMSPITDKIKKALNKGACRLLSPVPSSEVMKTMQSADILLHVEPQNLKERLLFRLSFSTKIVDYMYNAKCILAIGGNTGTIKYLKESQSALIAANKHDIEIILKEICDNPLILKSFSDKAWECGQNNHQITLIQKALFSDLKNIINDAN